MKKEEALELGRDYLDEATENLTFEEFGWAFEEVWHGVGWVLNSLREVPAGAVELGALGEKGNLPVAGTLVGLLGCVVASGVDVPRAVKVVHGLEALRVKIGDGDVDKKYGGEIAGLVFGAWELHDVCGERLQLVDARLGDKRLMLAEVSPGRVGSRVIERRTALKILAAASVLPFAACSKVEADNRGGAGVKAKASEKLVSAAEIRAVTPIRGMNWETSDPFLFCAYHVDNYPAGDGEMRPAVSLAGRHLGRDFEGRDGWRMYHGQAVPGFPRHPHRGFETVTVCRSGYIDHADSLGATARYGAGDVQWLTAGRGMQHAEMFPLVRSDVPNPLELFQIWLNLPRKDKMVEPHFTMLWSDTIPRVVETDAAGRIVELTMQAGRFGEHVAPAPPPSSWASAPENDVAIWTLRMEAGARFELPAVREGTLRSLYVHGGAGAKVGDRAVGNMQRIEVTGAGSIWLEAGAAETEVLLLQGRPIDEPVAKRGPFVMNTQEEIRQAYADYQATGFGGWPWKGDGPVHAVDKKRFAEGQGG